MGRTEIEIAWLHTQEVCNNLIENTPKGTLIKFPKRFHVLRELYLVRNQSTKETTAKNSESSLNLLIFS